MLLIASRRIDFCIAGIRFGLLYTAHQQPFAQFAVEGGFGHTGNRFITAGKGLRLWLDKDPDFVVLDMGQDPEAALYGLVGDALGDGAIRVPDSFPDGDRVTGFDGCPLAFTDPDL